MKRFLLSAFYMLLLSIIGYSQPTPLKESEKDEKNKTKVEDKLINIDQIVVSATRNESKRREAPSVVNVIGKELFESASAVNVGQALNFIPGIRVDVSCQNCAVTQVRINGLDGQYSQILLDSRPLFSSLASVYGIDQLPVEMIDRVEVIRGGGSAIFGSNAIGGVINIITKDPINNSVTISNNSSFIRKGVSDITTSFNGSFVSDDYKSGLFLFGIVRDRDSYDRDKDGFSDIPVLNSETIGFRGYHKVTSKSRIGVEYHHIKEFRRGGDSLNLPPHQAMIAEQLRHNIDGGSIKYDYISSDLRHRFNLFTSAQFISRESYFGTNQDLDAYGKSIDNTYTLGGQYTLSGDHLLFSPYETTIGVEYSGNELNDRMMGYNRDINQHAYTYGGYLQNEWKSLKYSFLAGFRVDKSNFIDNPIISPRVNFRYTPHSSIVLRGSYSSGYRAPQIYSEDLHVEAVGGNISLIVSDPDLKPEYSHSLSASADWIGSVYGFDINFLAETFYTDLKDVFSLTEIGQDSQGNLILERRNERGARIFGLNTEFKVAYNNRFSAQMGYTIQSSRYKDPFTWWEDGDLEPQKRMLKTPDSYGYFTLNFSPGKRDDISFSGTYTGDMLVPHYEGYIEKNREENVPSFWDFGIKYSYSVNLSEKLRVKLSCGVKNIFDAYQKDLDKGPERDAGYIYGPVLPRSINFGVKFEL